MNRHEQMRWYVKEADAVLIYDAPDPDSASACSIEYSTDMTQIRAAYAPLRLRQMPGIQQPQERDLLTA